MASKLKTPLRRRLLNNLNRQRNSLMKQQANLRDIDYLFGMKSNEKLSNLTTSQLQKLSTKINSLGKKYVDEKGRIVTSTFLKNKRVLERLTDYKINTPISLEKQINSKIFRYKNKKQIVNEINSNWEKDKNRYIKKVRNIEKHFLKVEGVKYDYKTSINKQLKDMSIDEFREFIERGGGLVDFDTVMNFYPDRYSGFRVFDVSDEVYAEESKILINISRFMNV